MQGKDQVRDEFVSLGQPYASAVKPGLQALARQHRRLVTIRDSRRLTDSIDLDTTLSTHPQHASAARWDYGIGFQPSDASPECAVWVEVHQARPSSVREMVAKARWLTGWLESDGSLLRDPTQRGQRELGSAFFWVAEGSDSLARTGSVQKKLASVGLAFPSRKLDLP